MKKIIILFTILFTQVLLANEPMLKQSKYKYVQQSIGKGKPYLLELGADSCRSCQIMGAMLYRVKEQNPQYNIHFINLQEQRQVAYDLNVRMIPTQIVYDKDGKEVYRHIGVLSANKLHEVLKKYKF